MSKNFPTIYDRKLRNQSKAYGGSINVSKIWRQSVKQAAAAQRGAQRQALQRHKALVKQQAELAKMQAKQRAIYEVQLFENRLDMLVSVHEECAAPFDWFFLAKQQSPVAPTLSNTQETIAQEVMSAYRPNFFMQIFGLAERKRLDLEKQVQLARQQDQLDYQELLEQHNQMTVEWEHDVELAKRVLNGERQAYIEAIHETQPFVDVEELGSRIEVTGCLKTELEITLHVNNKTVIPSEIKSLLKSGNVSTKKMPQGQYNELYQDYVCGCLFRVARELFALLPVQTVVVHCRGALLDSTTGHYSEVCLLSVRLPRIEVESLNFSRLDPSDALVNFTHNMNFKKTKGFSPVSPL